MVRLFDPLTVGSLKLKNRIVMAPMAFGLSNEQGEITDELLEHYIERCQYLGLLIVEATNITQNGLMFKKQLSIASDESIIDLKRLVSEIHKYDTPVAIQLAHAGSTTTRETCGEQPIAPSPVINPIRGKEIPREMKFEDIETVIEAFVEASERARKAGFDAVEIHGAHGYLLSQFLSPITNQRDDEFGGSLENRVKISLRIIDGIKNRLGADFPVLYRLGVEDVLPDGLSLDEGVLAAKMLFEMGVDIMDVSMGLGFTLRWLNMQEGFGIIVPQAAAVRKKTGFPVIGVGGVNTPEEADEIIRSGKVDLVAVGRALRREPRWASIAIDSLTDT